MQLSVLIPAYNEGQVIVQTLAAASEALTGLDYELVVVDDGSHDETYARVREAAATNAR